MLLWLWYRLAAAAPIRPLSWKLPYALGTTLKHRKKKLKRPREDTDCHNQHHLLRKIVTFMAFIELTNKNLLLIVFFFICSTMTEREKR